MPRYKLVKKYKTKVKFKGGINYGKCVKSVNYRRCNITCNLNHIIRNNDIPTSIRTNVRGAQVNALLNQIQMSNVTYQDDSSRQVKVTVEGGTSWNGTAPSGNLVGTGSFAKANTGATYNVDYKTDSKTGLINEIIIKNAGTK